MKHAVPLPFLLALGLSAFAGTACSAAGAPEATAHRANNGDVTLRTEAGKLANQLGSGLRDELMAAMQGGGPQAAISVCRDKAGPAARELAAANPGWQVGRTSLRTRNPDNAPDEWEARVLEQFTQRMKAGEAPAGIEHEEWVTDGKHRHYRYMKAIPVQEMCTVCHGESIAPELKQRIDSLYPADRATGYKPGELRGAFTLTRQLD